MFDMVNKKKWNEVNWEAQWADREGYRDGFVHVDLSRYASTSPSSIKLAPGPGFGDFSHPTTRLVLSLMGPHIKNQSVIDIGCGSGILSLAATAMGASSVCGIDIDPEAVAHSAANGRLNGMQNIDFFLPEVFPNTYNQCLVLINMIQSEQAVAYGALAPKIPLISKVISSGVLVEGRDKYLSLCEQWGWKLIEEKEQKGWLGFVFSNGLKIEI